MNWHPNVVVYHGNCEDGFGGAFAAWKRWGSHGIEYLPFGYGQNTPVEALRGKDVLMVDFSFKRQAMKELAQIVRTMVVLDHHKTAQAELEPWTVRHHTPASLADGLQYEDFLHPVGSDPIMAIFDMEKSGARMAWEFCWSTLPVPRLIEFIEDRDLWRFRFGDDTRRISALLRSHVHDFALWDKLLTDCQGMGFDQLIKEGDAILRAHRKNVEAFCQNAYLTNVCGNAVPVVNVPYHYASDCAHELLKMFPEAPFAASWYRRGDGKVGWSLRSEDSRADVSEVARSAGGGGHRNAAGFEVAV